MFIYTNKKFTLSVLKYMTFRTKKLVHFLTNFFVLNVIYLWTEAVLRKDSYEILFFESGRDHFST